jgi:hypothetical protein
VQFDDEIFTVIYVDDPSVEDEEILDMFLDSQGRRQIERLEIHSQFEHPDGPAETHVPMLFTSEALRRFFSANEQRKGKRNNVMTSARTIANKTARSPSLSVRFCLDTEEIPF